MPFIHPVNIIQMYNKRTYLLTKLTVIAVTFIFGMYNANSAINRNTPFKFFEKSKLIENEDGSFVNIYTPDRYQDIIPLERAYCFLDSLILTDITSAVYLWESQGKCIRFVSNRIPDKIPVILINLDNLPFNDRVELSPVYKSICKQFEGIMFVDNPKEIWGGKKALKGLKKGEVMIDFDYAIKGDSLITTIYRCLYRVDGDRSKKIIYEHINFIRKYNCTDGKWDLVNVNDRNNYFPDIYASDYLREAISADLNYYLTFLYRYYCWNQKKWSEKYRNNDDECGYNDRNDGNSKDLIAELSFTDFCKKYYLNSSTFPIGMLDNLKDPINFLPRDYYYRIDYRKFSKHLFEESKLVTTLELKIENDMLIIHFNTDNTRYCPKNKTTEYASSKFGFFVHKYDCDTNQWKRIGEYIYVY